MHVEGGGEDIDGHERTVFGEAARSKCPPLATMRSAPAPPQRAPGGSGRLERPEARPPWQLLCYQRRRSHRRLCAPSRRGCLLSSIYLSIYLSIYPPGEDGAAATAAPRPAAAAEDEEDWGDWE